MPKWAVLAGDHQAGRRVSVAGQRRDEDHHDDQQLHHVYTTGSTIRVSPSFRTTLTRMPRDAGPAPTSLADQDSPAT